jgi:hypothetical protein
MYANRGDLTFEPIANPSQLGYPMGLGFGDENNDGRIDLYFSNVGPTLPKLLVRGDLRDDQVLDTDYMLFRNQGGLRFDNVAEATGTARHGFGWGVVFHDMNLDGRQDILAAQNYARFPGVEYLELYPGRLLEQRADGVYVPVEETSGAGNQHFGIAPVIIDFDRDGWPDLAWGNLDGPLRVLRNRGGLNHWLKVRLADTPASIGAIVRVEMADGQVLTDQFATSEGLCSDSTHELFFGLGAEGVAERVTVSFQGPSRAEVVFERPAENTILRVP